MEADLSQRQLDVFKRNDGQVVAYRESHFIMFDRVIDARIPRQKKHGTICIQARVSWPSELNLAGFLLNMWRSHTL